MSDSYYICDECGRHYYLVESGSSSSRCGSCNRAYEEERAAIERRREMEDYEKQRRREQEDREDERERRR